MRCTSLIKPLLLASLIALGACAGGPGPAIPSPGDSVSEKPAVLPGTVVAPEIAAQYAEAVAFLQGGDLANAERAFTAFSRRHPSYAGGYTNLAIIYQQTDRAVDARAALVRALAVNPDYPPALNQLGISERESGRFAEAEAAYLKAVTVKPDYALAHFNLGILHELYLGNLELALASYQTFQDLQVTPDPQVAKWITDLTRRVQRGSK